MVLPKIKKIQTDVCQDQKQIAYLKQKELPLLQKKEKSERAKGKTFVSNTKAAKVTKMGTGGTVPKTKAKRPFKGKVKTGTVCS